MDSSCICGSPQVGPPYDVLKAMYDIEKYPTAAALKRRYDSILCRDGTMPEVSLTENNNLALCAKCALHIYSLVHALDNVAVLFRNKEKEELQHALHLETVKCEQIRGERDGMVDSNNYLQETILKLEASIREHEMEKKDMSRKIKSLEGKKDKSLAGTYAQEPIPGSSQSIVLVPKESDDGESEGDTDTEITKADSAASSSSKLRGPVESEKGKAVKGKREHSEEVKKSAPAKKLKKAAKDNSVTCDICGTVSDSGTEHYTHYREVHFIEKVLKKDGDQWDKEKECKHCDDWTSKKKNRNTLLSHLYVKHRDYYDSVGHLAVKS